MWICPTKRQDEFYDIDKLISILKDKLPEFNYFNCGIGRYSDSQLPVGFITINVSKNKVDLFQMYCYTESPLDATDSDNKNMTIEDLDKMGYEDLADKLIGFLEIRIMKKFPLLIVLLSNLNLCGVSTAT